MTTTLGEWLRHWEDYLIGPLPSYSLKTYVLLNVTYMDESRLSRRKTEERRLYGRGVIEVCSWPRLDENAWGYRKPDGYWREWQYV